jgi:hypothetical protein
MCASFCLRSSERLPLLVTSPTSQQRPEPVAQGRKFLRDIKGTTVTCNCLNFLDTEKRECRTLSDTLLTGKAKCRTLSDKREV